MKKIIMIAFLIAPFFLTAQSNAASQLAAHIANKMKDTLNLTMTQRNQVYDVNILLHNLKAGVRQRYTNPDSLRVYFQKIENRRDTLYYAVLPATKYTIYKQKKRNLVTPN